MKIRILIFGANGYLGSRLYFDLRNNFDVSGTYHNNRFFKEYVQLDVTNKEQVVEVLTQLKPDIIVHAANYPSPRDAVDNEENFKRLNLDATKFVEDAANNIGAKVIFISSFAAYNPGTVYGEYKLRSEEIVKQAKSGYLVLRASLILGFSPNSANDRPFDRILKLLDEKTIAEFDTSWRFQPTYIGHISDVITVCIQKDISNKTLPVFCDSLETQYSTARDILKPFNIEVKPVDKKRNFPVAKVSESELSRLGLPTLSYKEMVSKIHEEIKDRSKFVL